MHEHVNRIYSNAKQFLEFKIKHRWQHCLWQTVRRFLVLPSRTPLIKVMEMWAVRAQNYLFVCEYIITRSWSEARAWVYWNKFTYREIIMHYASLAPLRLIAFTYLSQKRFDDCTDLTRVLPFISVPTDWNVGIPFIHSIIYLEVVVCFCNTNIICDKFKAAVIVYLSLFRYLTTSAFFVIYIIWPQQRHFINLIFCFVI